MAKKWIKKKRYKKELGNIQIFKGNLHEIKLSFINMISSKFCYAKQFRVSNMEIPSKTFCP